jgi:hypothetical protein
MASKNSAISMTIKDDPTEILIYLLKAILFKSMVAIVF